MTVTEQINDAGRERTDLIEDSILPTLLWQRPIGLISYAWIWVGIAVIIATYSLGAAGVEGGVPLGMVIVIIILANIAIAEKISCAWPTGSAGS